MTMRNLPSSLRQEVSLRQTLDKSGIDLASDSDVVISNLTSGVFEGKIEVTGADMAIMLVDKFEGLPSEDGGNQRLEVHFGHPENGFVER